MLKTVSSGRAWMAFAVASTIVGACTSAPGDELGVTQENLLMDPDTDLDGVPNSVDNCPYVPNLGQANSNLESELASGHHQPPGDACDPSPIPVHEIRTDTYEYNQVFVGKISSLHRIYAIEPHDLLGNPGAPVEGWTGVRFCRCDTILTNIELPDYSPEMRSICGVTSGCGLNDTPGYDGDEPTAWQAPTVDYYPSPDDSAIPTTDLRDFDGDGDKEEVLIDYGLTARHGTSAYRRSVRVGWDYAADAATFGFSVGGFGEFSFPGVTWTHVSGADNGMFINRDWTSSYWSGVQSASLMTWPRAVSPDEADDFLPWLAPPEICPVCSYARAAWIRVPECLAGGCVDPLEVWFTDGSIDATSFFGWGTPEDLDAVQGEWVHASEPDGWRHYGVLHVSLSADGRTVHTVLSSVAGVGYSRSDRTTAGPSPLNDFGAVLSQQRGTLYVVGGLNMQNSPTRELWAYDVASDTWSSTTIAPTGGPERVLAAAYAPSEDALIVLDQDVSGAAVRLWHMPLPFSTSQFSLLGSWQRQQTFDEFAVAVEGDGEHYDILCDRGGNGHAVLRFSAAGRVIDSFAQSPSLLSLPVLLGHETGVSVLAQDGAGVELPLAHDSFDDNVGVGTSALCF